LTSSFRGARNPSPESIARISFYLESLHRGYGFRAHAKRRVPE
jgi:hypothetical protein